MATLLAIFTVTIAFTIAGIFITVSLVGLAAFLVRDAVRRHRDRRTSVDGGPHTVDAPD